MAYTVIDDASAHFQATGYTGDGGNQDITHSGNSDLQSDWIWIKNRDAESDHISQNTSLGITKQQFPSGTAQEYTSGEWGHVNSVSSDGFQVDEGNSGEANANKNSQKYISYNWKCNGGTTTTNTAGDIDTNVQVNSDAGFSIVTYSPPNATARTIGHGLGAVPKFIIIRARNRTENWHVFHHSMGTGGILLDTTAAHNSASVLGDTLPTSSVYKLGTDYRMNGDFDYVGYFFADVKGYSKFGKYKGNGSYDGIFVFTGFKPAMVIIKNTEQTEPWIMYDTTRNPSNSTNLKLSPSSALAENLVTGLGDAAYNMIDIYSNGFKLRSNSGAANVDDKTLMYAAWAEEPLVTSGGVPATAR